MKTQYEYKHLQIFQQQHPNESYVKHVKMKKHNNEYYPITRSNKVNLHALYFGIYEDLIYHHWAGSRRMITRQDRIKHKQLGGDGFKEDESLRRIAEENHQTSNEVFEQITHQQDTIMNYFMGNYEG